MKIKSFDQAIEDALAQAMAEDPRIIILGEDMQAYRMNLYARFGKRRVLDAPISESAFTGAAVTAALGGMRPVVDLTRVDFIAVPMDALLNHAAKVETFSGGRWTAPLVIRAASGGGYGDGGQHSQSLWGWLGHIPGLTVLVPSNPADAGGMMLASLNHDGPVVFLEPALLSDNWLDWLGGSQRQGTTFDIPEDGARGPVPRYWEPVPIGQATVCRQGQDLAMISVGVGVHRCLEVAARLAERGISATVVDLRTVAPLDVEAICDSVEYTGKLLVVDEDYERFGLSGEVAAVALEAGLTFEYARVCTSDTIPYARELEERMLPNLERILQAAYRVLGIDSEDAQGASKQRPISNQ